MQTNYGRISYAKFYKFLHNTHTHQRTLVPLREYNSVWHKIILM